MSVLFGSSALLAGDTITNAFCAVPADPPSRTNATSARFTIPATAATDHPHAVPTHRVQTRRGDEERRQDDTLAPLSGPVAFGSEPHPQSQAGPLSQNALRELLERVLEEEHAETEHEEELETICPIPRRCSAAAVSAPNSRPATAKDTPAKDLAMTELNQWVRAHTPSNIPSTSATPNLYHYAAAVTSSPQAGTLSSAGGLSSQPFQTPPMGSRYRAIGSSAMDATSSGTVFSSLERLQFGASAGLNAMVQPNFTTPSGARPSGVSSPQLAGPVMAADFVQLTSSPPHGLTGQRTATARIVTPQFTIETFRGKIAEAARDQIGWRSLHRVLEDSAFDSPEVQTILEEILPVIADIMADTYGNFLIQKLLDVAPDMVRLHITQQIAPFLPRIATTQHGTFAVQKLVQSLRSVAEHATVCGGLATDVVLLTTDPCGAHVVQRVLQCLDPPMRQFLYDGICRDLVRICNDRLGCCTVQKCLQHASTEQAMQVAIAALQNVRDLAPDPFGNYVLQFILESPRRTTEISDGIARALFDASHVVPFARDKFASNVLEKALRSCTRGCVADIIETLVAPDFLETLVSDPYGNYVVQSALNVAPVQLLPPFIAALQGLLPAIRQQPFSRKLEAKLEAAMRRAAQQSPVIVVGRGRV